MTTEQSASMDAALNDVFSPGRGRNEDAAKPEVAEATPTPAPVTPAEVAPQPEAEREDPVDHNKQVSVKEVFDEREKKRAYKAQYEAEQKRAATFEAQLRTLQEQNQQLIQGFSRPQHAAQPQAQPQQRPQLPDPQQYPFEHLQAVMQLQAEQIQAQRTDDKLNWSEDLARSKYGDDIVSAAQKAAMNWPPADLERLRSLRHPYDELVKWYRSQEALKTIGSDPEAYKKKIFEEAQAKILEDLKAGRLSANGLSGQQPAAAPAPQHFPGTLAAATQTGSNGQTTKTLEAATGDVFSPDRKVRGMRR